MRKYQECYQVREQKVLIIRGWQKTDIEFTDQSFRGERADSILYLNVSKKSALVKTFSKPNQCEC